MIFNKFVSRSELSRNMLQLWNALDCTMILFIDFLFYLLYNTTYLINKSLWSLQIVFLLLYIVQLKEMFWARGSNKKNKNGWFKTREETLATRTCIFIAWQTLTEVEWMNLVQKSINITFNSFTSSPSWG